MHNLEYGKTAEEYISQNHDFVVEHDGRKEMSGAALLLFGKDPQRFFPRARVRFIRYDGTEAKVGTEMNVIKDVTFNGRILDVVRQALNFVQGQIKERTRLGEDGRFVTTPEYPEFAWKEIIVNAIAHRDYSIKGTDIQIKMFDDRITVESPGTLPGIVRLNNLRTVHFSRNPKIAEFLHQYEYVKEFGEGIDRMFNEMKNAGLPEPEYTNNAFMLNVTIRNNTNGSENGSDDSENGSDIIINLTDNEKLVYKVIASNPEITRQKMIETLGLSIRTLDRVIKSLKDKGVIKRIGSDRGGHWSI